MRNVLRLISFVPHTFLARSMDAYLRQESAAMLVHVDIVVVVGIVVLEGCA
jgi:hypothetical protein